MAGAQEQQKALAELPPPALIPESWVKQYFGTTDINDPKVGGYYGDPDGDHLNNYQEYLYGTDPTKKDTDGDGYNDGTEVALGSDPLNRGISSKDQMAEQRLKQAGVYIDFKEIEKEFHDYLNPDRQPKVADIPDSRFKIIDNSETNVKEYYNSFKTITAFEDDPATLRTAETLFEGLSKDQIATFISKQSQVITGMLSLPVPQGLLAVHKMYLKNYQLVLSMAEYANSQISQGKAISVGNFYPELSLMLQLDPELKQLKLDAATKYRIPI